jgi:hypothetical protein
MRDRRLLIGIPLALVIAVVALFAARYLDLRVQYPSLFNLVIAAAAFLGVLAILPLLPGGNRRSSSEPVLLDYPAPSGDAGVPGAGQNVRLERIEASLATLSARLQTQAAKPADTAALQAMFDEFEKRIAALLAAQAEMIAEASQRRD